MQIRFSPNKSLIAVFLAWAFLGVYFYSPLTNFVTSKVLERFRPVAYTGEIYTLTKIDKESYYARASAYSPISSSAEYSIGSNVTTIDGRAAALRKFLRDQNSPLMPYSELIVKEADKFDLDWRLVPAISGIESRFCRITPTETNNCWGWKGGPGGTWQKFEDYGVGVKVLTSRLALGYGIELTPYEIEPAYCPPCAASGHSWAHAVTQYMSVMSSYLEKSRVNQ